MNVRLKHSMEFNAGVHWADRYFISHYTLILNLITGTADIASQNIALNRMQHMVYQEFSDALFINQDNKNQIKLYRAAGLKIAELPEEPLDQIIGIMLFCKLNAVGEGRLIITDIEAGSDQGDDMYYCHSGDENIGPFGYEGWWNESGPKITGLKSKSSRVVEMSEASSWKYYGLEWPEDQEDIIEKSKAVILTFKKDEPK